jgi:ankyrin repeat protein
MSAVVLLLFLLRLLLPPLPLPASTAKDYPLLLLLLLLTHWCCCCSNTFSANMTSRPLEHWWALLQEGWTPLHLAARIGQQEVVRELLSAGADMNISDKVRPPMQACPLNFQGCSP